MAMKRKVVAAVVINEILLQEEENKRNRKIWVKEWLAKRNKFSHTNLLRELEATAPEDYRNFLRMDNRIYEELLQKVAPLIVKQDTQMREAISPHERLSTTLRFLATGETFASLKFKTYISQPSLSNIIIETCEAIITVLKHFVHMPRSEEEWEVVGAEFNELWNFINCLGAIDGKHINITKPINSGSYYFNYKKSYSIVLMALVNAKYEFLMVEVGANGRVSDAGVFANTKFNSMFEQNQLNLPSPTTPHNFEVPLPYVFVADDAFPLRENLMKPYGGIELTSEQQYFNKRLSRARRIVENVFGIIASRFRVLLTTINLSPEKATKVVLAICYLHNFLRARSSTYLQGVSVENSRETTDSRESMFDLQATRSSNSTNTAKTIRNNFCTYFNTSGKIDY